MNMIISWLILTAAVWITSLVLPGFRINGGIGGTLSVAALYGILQWLLGWLLFVLIGVGTLGVGFLLAFVTRLVVGAIVLKIVDALTDRLTIEGFGWALGAATCISAAGTLAEYMLK